MKKMFSTSKRTFLSMLTLVAFLFIGMSNVAAQESNAEDLDRLILKRDQIATQVEALPDSPKKTYYTNLVSYYNAIIEDVQNENVPYIRAVKTNSNLMPMGPNGKMIRKDLPISNRLGQ